MVWSQHPVAQVLLLLYLDKLKGLAAKVELAAELEQTSWKMWTFLGPAAPSEINIHSFEVCTATTAPAELWDVNSNAVLPAQPSFQPGRRSRMPT